jgi:thiol-disulfide isomerase/thioredoxin
MRYRVQIILSVFAFVVWSAVSKAQPGTTLITGTVAEKANVELTIYKTVDKKREMVANYKTSPANADYAFAIPVEKGASYTLSIALMKQGHVRLEVDKGFSFPLQLKAGHNVSMRIIPSALNAAQKKGLEIKGDGQYPDVSLVSGNVVNSIFGPGDVSVQKVVDGRFSELATYHISKTNKRFQLAIPVREQEFYYVTALRWRCRIYLKPADNLELAVNNYSGEYEIINGSEENRLMEKWQKLSLPITDYGYNRSLFQNDSLDFNAYASTYEKLQPAIADFRSNSKLANQHFNRLFDQAITVDNEFAPLYLLSCLSKRRTSKFISVSNNFNNPPAFYRQFIHAEKFQDANILKVGEGMDYVNMYQKLMFAFMPEAERKKLWREDRMKIMMDMIGNDTVKAFFLKDQLGVNEWNNLSEFKAIYQPFEKYTFPPTVKKKYQEVYEGFIGDTVYLGKSSYNFSLTDTSGRAVTMKDFKGKVIFIDAWATWCGPCREQLPFLKEVEEEYKDNKDIVFMGISIDRAKDQEKWLSFIQKEKLQGVQLLDSSKEFRERYGVNSVPRFLLIDRQGNWIEVRCPRPEAKAELKRYLDSALQQDGVTSNK